MIHKYRQVHWNIPKDLYDRLERCHEYAKKRIPGTPDSEEIFAIMALDDAIKACEAIKRADQLIVVPELIIK